MRNCWTDNEIEYLKENHLILSIKDLGSKLNRSESSIKYKAMDLNLTENNFWTVQDIEFLKNNYLILKIEDLKKSLNRTKKSIQCKASMINLTTNYFWTDDEIEYLKKNYPDGDPDLLKLNLDRHTWIAIKTKAFSIGLKRNGLSIDEDFFKNWTKEMAWTFGLWIADGNIYKKQNIISFVSNDYDMLEIVKSNLKSEHKISRCDNAFQLHISNKIMYGDLLKLGGIPRKSLTIKFPEIPDEFLSHFIRGEFDGDGGFCVREQNKHKYLESYCTGNIDFLTILIEKIKENAGIDPPNLYNCGKNCNPKIKQIHYSGKKAIALGDYIYKESKNLRLERKFKIYDKMKNEYLKKLEEKNRLKN